MIQAKNTEGDPVPAAPSRASQPWCARLTTPLIVASFLAFALIGPSSAQTNAAPPGMDPAAFNGLMKRMEALEAKAKRVDLLESQVRELKTKTGESVAPALFVEQWPKIDIHVLGDVDYHVSNAKGDPNQFLLGDLDIVTMAHLNDKASVLADLVITSDRHGFATEIERLVLSYQFNDNFKLEAGRFHTAMGWYNNFYHNGTYFQTTVERPAIYLFEDGEGILPVHSTGISLSGEIPSGKLGLSYSLEVAQGRNYVADTEESLNVEDHNDYKSVNVQIRAKPEWTPNWQLGLGTYHDTLTPELDPLGAPGARTRVDQLIFSGYAVYKTPIVEWYTEGILMGNAPRDDHRHWTTAAYTQVSRRFGKLRPYARMQWRNSPTSDPVLGLIGQNVSVWGPQIGVRYDFTEMMALKFEYEHFKARSEPSVDEFTVQWAYRF